MSTYLDIIKVNMKNTTGWQPVVLDKIS